MALAQGRATGVQFAPVSQAMLEGAIRRTAGLYLEPTPWHQIQANGMASDVSWREPARHMRGCFGELAG